LHQRILEKKLETIYAEVELPLAPLLYRMERSGLKVDQKGSADLSNYIGQELHKLTTKIYQLAGREFNIGSPKQVGEVLSELISTSGGKLRPDVFRRARPCWKSWPKPLNCRE
jgi:DNA polymerase-1